MNIGIHRINSDPVLAHENAKNGRKNLSRESELKMMESWRNKIKDSYWWNDGIKNIRSKECPGITFKRGMKK